MTKHIVSFLDFDDVLNSHEYTQSNFVKELKKTKQYSRFAPHELLDKKAVELYNEFVKKTNAKTVISSNWRFYYTLNELKDILSKVGFKGEIIGTTPAGRTEVNYDLLSKNGLKGTLRWYNGRFPFYIRGHLIFQKAVELNLSPQQIVIFDDRDDMQPLFSRLIRTEETEGLTKKHLKEAYELLGL